MSMRPILEMTDAQIRGLRYLLCDIDDTITRNGKLPAASYAALWRLQEAGIDVIPVTGRPAGWCDLIVRQWPVRAVVGENGAFVYYTEAGKIRTFTHPAVRPDARDRLREILAAAMAAVPGCREARDQFARLYDLAIDFREDPPYLSLAEAEKIRTVCCEMGAVAKISSIHVNAWFGDYDKVTTTELFFREILCEPDFADTAVFFGDSPNDEPMFRRFPLSCGVANIRPFADRMACLPAFVTERESADGFADAAAYILSRR